jgi:hypothetical protein
MAVLRLTDYVHDHHIPNSRTGLRLESVPVDGVVPVLSDGATILCWRWMCHTFIV